MRVRARFVLAFGLLVLGAVLWLGLTRARATDRLRALLDSHRAAGIGVSEAELFAEVPPIDAEIQKRIWAWMDVPDQGLDASEEDYRWFLEGRKAPPPKVAEWLESYRPRGEEFLRLLGDPRARLSSIAWRILEPGSAASLHGVHKGPRLTLFDAQRWLLVLSLQGDARALESFDWLRMALEPFGAYMDAAIAQACDYERDRTHFLLAMRGRLPATRADPWLAERSNAERRWSDALRAERILVWNPIVRDVLEGRSVRDRVGETGSRNVRSWWRQNVAFRLHGRADAAAFLHRHEVMEGYLVGRRSADDVRAAFAAARDLHWPFWLGWSDPSHFVGTAHGIRTQHRLVRLAAALCLDVHAGKELPTLETLRARLGPLAGLLDAGRFDSPLRYARKDPYQFALEIDPSAPLPDFVPRAVRPPLRDGETADFVLSPASIEVRLPPTVITK